MRYLLLDGYNLMHRARFGMRNGDHYIIFNFFRSLRPLVEKFAPCKVVLFLEGSPTHRLQLDADYKANRATVPGTKQHEEILEFRKQKKTIISLLQKLPVTIAKHDAVECDDLIGSWVQTHKDTSECIVVSTDTDYIQLLTHDNVKLYNPVRKEFVEPAPYDYITWKALRGDKTDNVPPLPGITDGKATKICADPALLAELRNDPIMSDLLDRNLQLIGFKQVSVTDPEYSQIDPTIDFDGLKQEFNSLQFFSITNKTSWPKYCATFAEVYK